MTRSMHWSALAMCCLAPGCLSDAPVDAGHGGVEVGDRAGDADAAVDLGDDDPDRADDGDHDVPGDPGDGDDEPIDPDGGDACEACVDQNCAEAWQGCENEAECVALDECGAACTDDACVEQCDQAHPNGVAPLTAFYDCLDTSCATPCGGGEVDPGDDAADPGEDPADPGGDDGWAACDACADQSCADSFGTCAQDADCSALLGCYDGCGEQDQCYVDCETAHESGTQIYDSFVECLAASCNTECGFEEGEGDGA